MTHVMMLYYATLPDLVLILLSFFGFTLSLHRSISHLFFLFHVNVLNWICGYHWSLSFQSVQSQTKISTTIISLLSIWAMFAYLDGEINLAKGFLSALYVFQLYCDFQSDITYQIQPTVKIARITMTVVFIYSIMRML
ncbi:MAG: hypothetical protein FJ161_03120 [Gammaproteobacteria bacterium]|nr:hypothetical protein [Gammaproteobacteria bacterium]